MTSVYLEDVIKVLIDHGVLQDSKELPTRTPTHGPCCTCQDCGEGYDECVCKHNALIKDLKSLVKHINQCFSCKYEPEWEKEWWDVNPSTRCRSGTCYKRPSLEYNRPQTVLIYSNELKEGVWEDGAWLINNCEYYEKGKSK